MAELRALPDPPPEPMLEPGELADALVALRRASHSPQFPGYVRRSFEATVSLLERFVERPNLR